MKTKYISCKKLYTKEKEDWRINKLSLFAWVMAMLFAAMFWSGIFHAFEGGFVSQCIAKLHLTTVIHFAKR